MNSFRYCPNCGYHLKGDEKSVLLGEKKKSQTFPIWKTVKLGEYKSCSEYVVALEKSGTNISPWAKGLLEKMPLSVAEEVDLVRVTVKELGFGGYARFDAIVEHAKELGLELCPAEVGPALRLQYSDQPIGEWVTIAMEPITGRDGYPDVFRVGRSPGGLWLRNDWASPGIKWDSDRQFLFRHRKLDS
jgi:hypothetical protein